MYLPFMESTAHPAMGLKPLALTDWFDLDADFSSHLAEKETLLAKRHSDVFAALPETEAAQAEVLQMVVEHLTTHHSTVYERSDATLYNRITHRTIPLPGTDDGAGLAPLDQAGRLVQEDLCILLPDERGYLLAAASVCFPLRWSLREKLGQPLGQIHQRVPEYPQKLERPVDLVFAKLRRGYPGVRFNWSLVDSPELYLGQSKGVTAFNPTITAANAGRALWLRVERQTLCRLPVSQGVLFTIRTYLYPLHHVAAQPQVAARLAEAVRRLHPDMQVYKNLLPFREVLLTYLGDRAQSCCP